MAWSYRSKHPTSENFLHAYDSTPPWDIGHPQKVVVDLYNELALKGSVLDVGCGTGEHVLFFASKGLKSVGLDSNPIAIEKAMQKMEQKNLDASFLLGDALELSKLHISFDIILDCGLYHVLSDSERITFLREVRKVIKPGGIFILLGFDSKEPRQGPRGFGEKEIRQALSKLWTIEILRSTRFESNIHYNDALAWIVVSRPRV